MLPHPKLLSFGCSTGEEVFTLAEYLPHADIVGVDINEWCLAECRRKDSQHRHTFHHRRSSVFESAQDFDAIFCLAVFQHPENRNNPDNAVAAGHTFDQFEREVALLDAKLKSGGLFVIDHADFSFAHTASAANYTPLDVATSRRLRIRPIYGRDNHKLADRHESHRIFVKRR